MRSDYAIVQTRTERREDGQTGPMKSTRDQDRPEETSGSLLSFVGISRRVALGRDFTGGDQTKTVIARRNHCFKGMAGGPGFEPGLTESESAVLPLNDPPLKLPI